MKDLGPRIAVIGVSASGKSTLVHHLKKHLSLPAYHTDSYTWQDGWGNSKTNDQIIAHVETILNRSQWILEGYLGYVSLPDTRLQRATTVIVLDYHRVRLAWHYLKRHYTYHGKSRSELPEQCRETFNWGVIKKSLHFLTKKNMRNNLRDWTMNIPQEKILIFKKPRQLQEWLEQNDLS